MNVEIRDLLESDQESLKCTVFFLSSNTDRYVLRNLISQTEETAYRSAALLFLLALWLMTGWPGPLGALSMEVVSRLLQILTGREA